MNVCNISRLLAILLFVFLGISACKKTSYVSGPPPVLDTTGAVPVSADPPPPPPPPPGSTISKTLIFDGTSNYITVAKHADFDLSPGENYTITCWVRITNLKEQSIFRKRIDNGLGYEMNVNAAGVYHVNMRGNPGNANLGTNAAVASNLGISQWYHLAMVVNATDKTLKIYVDGVLNNTSLNITQIGTLDVNADIDVLIGYSPIGGGRYFFGQMDDIRVWNKAFTPAELLIDMTTASVDDTTPNLLSAWDFENITGNTATDVSGKGHNGTISGTVVLGERTVVK